MRVAIAHWTPRVIGGAEAYIDALVPALLARGVEVGLWYESEGSAGHPRIAASSPVPSWSAGEEGGPAALAALAAWRPSAVLVNMIHSLALEEALIRTAPAVLLVHTYHGTCVSGTKTLARPEPRPCGHRFGWPCLVRYFPRECGPRTLKTLARDYVANRRRLEVSRGYRAVVANSEHMRTEYARHGFRPEQLCRVPFFAPPPAAETANPPLPHPVRDRVPGSPLRLLFLGRLEELKGAHVLLQALPRVAASLDAPLELTIAGEGPARARLERVAETVRSECPRLRIDFAGWMAGTAKEELLASADLLVVPSLWPEPFGMVGVEAARYGVPAAAFRAGGIPEWLLDGVSGHLAPSDPPTPEGLADAILRCLRDPRHLASLRRGALEVSSRFSRERHVSELLRLFQRIGRAGAEPGNEERGSGGAGPP